MNTVSLLHISFEIWGGIFCLLTAVVVFFGSSFDRERAMLLLRFLIMTAIIGVFDALAWLFRGDVSNLGYYMVRIANFMVFLGNYILIMTGSRYLRYIVTNSVPRQEGRGKASGRWDWVVFFSDLLCITGIMLLILTQFFHFLYAFDEENRYYRLPLSYLQILLPMLCLLLLLWATAPYRKLLKREDLLMFLSSLCLLLIALVVLYFNFGVSFHIFATEITAMLYFVGYEIAYSHYARARERELAEKDVKLANQKLRIMQNQIRPHFIFNSLLAIKQLCIEDPKKASEALQHFAVYLRTNLEAMTDDKPVSFLKEIDCIKEYVALEMADPSSRFTVSYQLEFVDFSLPLLSVEPMVENAIRHGIATRRSGGIVTIRSYKEDGKAVVLVEDNGTGFGSETHQQKEHRSIGIQNVRERLLMSCNGELNIVDTGTGTMVYIGIPLEEKKTEEEG